MHAGRGVRSEAARPDSKGGHRTADLLAADPGAPDAAREWKEDVLQETPSLHGGPGIAGVPLRLHVHYVRYGQAIGGTLHLTPPPSSPAPVSVTAPAPDAGSASMRRSPASSSDDGIAFKYREKYPHTSFAHREMAAYYVHRLNRSWKTRTFLSRGFYNGSAEWHGGLALAYDF